MSLDVGLICKQTIQEGIEISFVAIKIISAGYISQSFPDTSNSLCRYIKMTASVKWFFQELYDYQNYSGWFMISWILISVLIKIIYIRIFKIDIMMLK